jgi:potassium-dependent mechanosensitive channel
MDYSKLKWGIILLALLFLGSSWINDLSVHATEVPSVAPEGISQQEQAASNKPGPLSLQESDRKRFIDRLQDSSKIWNIEMFVIDGHPVTIGKLLFALIVLVIGIVFAKILLWTFANRLLARSQLKETTASAIQKLFSYLAYLLVLLFVLRILNIPIAAFAFLGGAIAIGVGFGAQNLINNFISGFILMAERPISIGNLIEVDGVLGQVEEIGARCTRMRTGENIHILVPNSAFLEKNITNWTLSDQKIRTKVIAGVIYGSPVHEVTDLLIKAAKGNDKVLRDPEPFVVFADFGDNALTFEIYFWINIRRVIERRLIESDIRFRIDELFREAGIVIAFPQRDVHIDTLRPLEMRLVESKDS